MEMESTEDEVEDAAQKRDESNSGRKPGNQDESMKDSNKSLLSIKNVGFNGK